MKTTIGLTVLTVLSSGCATTIQAGADFAPGVDLNRFSSFTWAEPDERPVGDPRLENNPFFVQRLHDAIEWELATRGIRFDEANPALTVHHHATVRERIDVYAADRDAGYTSAEYGEGTHVTQFAEGTFLVDIADAATDEILWRGWAQLDIGAALGDPERMREQVDEALRRMFVGFPVTRGVVAPAR